MSASWDPLCYFMHPHISRGFPAPYVDAYFTIMEINHRFAYDLMLSCSHGPLPSGEPYVPGEIPLPSAVFLTEGNEVYCAKAWTFHRSPYLEFSRKDSKAQQIQPVDSYRFMLLLFLLDLTPLLSREHSD